MTYQSEVAVLNILMHNPEVSVDILPEYFSSTAHINLFKIIEEITHNGKEVEPSLIKLLAKNKNLDIGGEDYVDVIYTNSFSPSNLEDYITEIEEEYKKRKLYNIITYVRDGIHDGLPVDKIIDIVENDISSLRISSVTETEFLYSDADEFLLEIIEESKSGKLPGFSTGFSKIDAITSGIRPGNLWIIAGRPGQGKSAWMSNSARNTEYNKVIFSLEMSKREYLEREFSIGSGIPLLNIRARALSNREINKLQETAEVFKKRNDIIINTSTNGIISLEKSIRKYVRDNNVKIVYIDYIQLLVDRNMDATHALGRASRKLKQLARELGIGIVVLSQLHRGVESREDKRPILSDLRQSGNLEEDADLVAFLYRDEYYNQHTKDKGVMEFIIRKHRNGPIGTIFLKFNKDTTEITEE